MAIFRKKNEKAIAFERSKGIENPDDDERVVDVCYTPSDALAQLVVDAWTKQDIRERLLDRTRAKALLAERGVFLRNPVVIKEEDYRSNVRVADDEVVLVLPDQDRVQFLPPGQSQNLLETARLLMSVTPNGI